MLFLALYSFNFTFIEMIYRKNFFLFLFFCVLFLCYLLFCLFVVFTTSHTCPRESGAPAPRLRIRQADSSQQGGQQCEPSCKNQ